MEVKHVISVNVSIHLEHLKDDTLKRFLKGKVILEDHLWHQDNQDQIWEKD